ncbi:hypothetical protein EZS27_010543 [termite gut metagenome]|uniref:Fibrobacter succinogenes major paralogous domain-containing protein n=1 Tax=termite gut metagenome TaxID=433724 RepID=A0A5J4S8F4_9ZZZZ
MYHLKMDLLRFMTLCSFIFCFFSCSNVPIEDDSAQEKIPISLSVSVDVSHTLVTGSSLEQGDAIGLYMMKSSSPEDSPYANNVKFTRSTSNNYISEESLFYPEEGEGYDFLAYYPYYDDNKIVEAGSTDIKVAIQTDQSGAKAFSASDFMIAEGLDISKPEEIVSLSFYRKMSCLNIRLRPGQGYTADGLLEVNPIVRISGMYTNALYNFSSGKFSSYNTPTDIIPNGTWKIDNGMLVGKSAIVIPQITSASRVSIELEVDGVFFDCKLGASFESGTSHDVTLTASPNYGGLPIVISSTDVSDWKEGQSIDIEATIALSPYVSMSNFTFSESLIYRLTADGSFVGEICREYLFADNINARAVVIYPVKDGKTDLTNGLAVLVEGSENKNVHGGKVSWSADGRLTYTAGASAPVNSIYMTSGGKIVTSREENVLRLAYHPYVLTDTRQTETCVYPIVKIGRQYWMGENLRASKYTNGTDILLAENCLEPLSNHYCIQDNSFFYNHGAVNTGILPPSGWKIADDDAWEVLKAYIGGSTSVLKSKSGWKTSNNQRANFTGFNATASGLYNKIYKYNGEYAAFWSVSNSFPNEANKSVIIEYDTDSMEENPSTGVLGLSVRCVLP